MQPDRSAQNKVPGDQEPRAELQDDNGGTDTLSDNEFSDDDSRANTRPQVIDTVRGKTKMPPALVILAGVVLTVLTVICLQVDDWSRDWTHNTAETDPDAKDVNMRPIDSSLTPNDFADLVIDVMQDVNRWDIKEKSQIGDEIVQVDLIHRTFFVGFKDDVQVEIVKTENGSTLYARSRSRIGQGDLGQNPRNIKELIGKVNQKLAEK